MTAESQEDRRLVSLTEICLAFPEATRRDMGKHASFLVRKKTFAYFLDDHHGDGIVSLCCKTSLGENADMIAQNPDRFYMPAYIGPKGWVALRLDVGEVDWDEVAHLVANSYRLVAPKRLASLVGAS
ncbi:MAG TPA: MmcQ/YjbR family DNA-binding protein [Thermoanaerobaculia bacterium]|nr:MmcQ/YjbR family DNA-binding protein [Thermoanaerobaculia bacterium]